MIEVKEIHNITLTKKLDQMEPTFTIDDQVSIPLETTTVQI